MPAQGETPETLNRRMIAELLASGAITSEAVAAAFEEVLRHRFVPGSATDKAYLGSEAIPTRSGSDGLSTSSSSAPSIMAPMLEQLGLEPGFRVLEIGAGTGYNAALMDVLVGPEGSVTSIDIQPDVVEEARANLERSGHRRVDVRAGDGWEGAPDRAPFDAIELTVGAEDISPHWVEQLRDGGALVLPLWLRAGIQVSIAFRKDGANARSERIVRCGFMRMQGAHQRRSAAVKLGSAVALFDRPELADEIASLLKEVPRREVVAEPPPGWFDRVALVERDAVPLTVFEEGTWTDRRGLLDAAAESLAVVSGVELLSYGSGTAAGLIRERLANALPFDVTAASIQAVPTADVAVGRRSRAVAWTIERPSYTFIVRERSVLPEARRDADAR